MIILDPDLDPDPAPSVAKPLAASGKSSSVASSAQKNLRLPIPRTLARFLSAAQVAVRLKGQVNVLLTTDAAIRKLNRQFRGKNKATDVLSFPAMNVPGIKGAEAPLAGDLAISVPTARKQAIAQGHSLSTEIKVLMLHGLLHLAGCDHETDTGQMARREAKLRTRLKLPLGLIERSSAQGLKPRIPAGGWAARLKSSPDTKRRSSGAKALVDGKPAKRGLQAPAPSDARATRRFETTASSFRAEGKGKRP